MPAAVPVALGCPRRRQMPRTKSPSLLRRTLVQERPRATAAALQERPRAREEVAGGRKRARSTESSRRHVVA